MTLTECTRVLGHGRAGKDALRSLEAFLSELHSLTDEQRLAVAELTRRFCTSTPKGVMEAVQAALAKD